MSSLKKHVFSATLPSIALHDFTPNAELFQYDLSAPAKNPTAKPLVPSHLHVNASDHQRQNAYAITHTFTLPSHTFTAPQQESRKPTLKDYDTALNHPTCPAEIHPERTQPHPQDFWLLTQHDRTLAKGSLRISLTTIESALIKKMLHHEERVVSKEELIRNIGREPDLYRGLEMCLSRLQEKFKRANDGERLFRAVRNRGYCLTQKIKKPLELTSTRR